MIPQIINNIFFFNIGTKYYFITTLEKSGVLALCFEIIKTYKITKIILIIIITERYGYKKASIVNIEK